MNFAVSVTIWVWMLGAPTTGNPSGQTPCVLVQGAAFHQTGESKYDVDASPAGDGNVCPIPSTFVMGPDDLAQHISNGEIKQIEQ